MKRILVIAAHPDDELLGTGATIRKHAEAGNEVHCVILGEGILSRTKSERSEVDVLKKAGEKANRIIGAQSVRFFSFPDNAFDTVSLLEIAKTVEQAVDNVRPDIVYTHFGNDLNIDHRRTFEAVMTACRPCNPHAPKTIFSFEILSSTEWQSKRESQFAPDTYEDISKTLEKKIEALECYASELRPFPHSRSLEGVRLLAGFRGIEAGLPSAEAFMTIRRVIG